MEKTVGFYLKKAREEKNLTIEDVSKNTKIPVDLIQDIEANRFSNIGGVGYAKAMIVTIAKNLGANEQTALDLFISLNNEKIKPTNVISNVEQERKFMISGHFFAIAIIIIIVGILSVFLINVYKQGSLHFPFSVSQKTEKSSETLEKKPISVKKNEEKVNKKNTTGVEKTQSKKVDSKVSKKEKNNDKNKKYFISEKSIFSENDYVNELLFKYEKSPLNIDLK